jgi:hypothetical protein
MQAPPPTCYVTAARATICINWKVSHAIFLEQIEFVTKMAFFVTSHQELVIVGQPCPCLDATKTVMDAIDTSYKTKGVTSRSVDVAGSKLLFDDFSTNGANNLAYQLACEDQGAEVCGTSLRCPMCDWYQQDCESVCSRPTTMLRQNMYGRRWSILAGHV